MSPHETYQMGWEGPEYDEQYVSDVLAERDEQHARERAADARKIEKLRALLRDLLPYIPRLANADLAARIAQATEEES